MKDLKCKYCGAAISLDEDKEFATCKYCGTKYKLNEDKNIIIKLDDNTKDVLDKGLKTASKVWVLAAIPFVLAFLVIVVVAITMATSIRKNKVSENNTIDVTNEINEEAKKDDIDNFNRTYEFYSGTKWKINIETLLDKVITNNTKNTDKIITIIYGSKSATEREEIIDIKHSLEDFKDYEVKVDYGDNGYINKITIEDI